MSAPADTSLEELQNRLACSDLVIAFANALDERDWVRYRALFEDRIRIDYASIGSISDTISADEWTARCRLLECFNATRHRITNLVCEFGHESATVRCAIDAVHFISAGGEILAGDLCGSYTHELVQRADGWRIAGCQLDVAGYPLGKTAFDTVFAAARIMFGRRESG